MLFSSVFLSLNGRVQQAHVFVRKLRARTLDLSNFFLFYHLHDDAESGLAHGRATARAVAALAAC